MTLRRSKRTLVSASLLVAALSVGACASGPGTAVESMGVRYSERDVTVAVDELAPAMQGQGDRQTVVNMLVQAQPIIQTAQAAGLVSEGDEEFAAQEILGISADDLGRATRDILLTAVYAGQVGPAVNVDDMLPPETVVNPRYGSFNPETGQLQVLPLGDVVTTTGQQ